MSYDSIFKPYGLLCEYSVNPIGIDVKLPRFSWKLNHGGRDITQSSYQIQVAKNIDNLMESIDLIWDSGKVDSKKTTILFNGNPLESCERYVWRVRWWNQRNQESQFSEIATFETGLLEESDWKSKWIEGKDLFRKKVTINREIESVRVYISGLGFYEIYVNGKRIGDHVLDPGWTSYDELVLYSTYDITQEFVTGENIIGVMLGNGRYAQKSSENLPPYMYEFIERYGHPPKKLLLQVHVNYVNGIKDLIISDESWRTENGPIIEDDIFNGEKYDARLEKPGWTRSGFNDSDWIYTSLTNPPGGKLVSQASCPPIKKIRNIQPINLHNPEPGSYIYDMGQNFAGWVKLKVQGPRGSEVRLRFAELLGEDQTLKLEPNRSAEATSTYILKGENVEFYEPRFTYYGFRYVEVTGYPGTPKLDSIEGVVVNTDVNMIGGFSCSNNLINNIHKNIIWGQLSNLMSIPTDCPQRDERLGWTGDAQLTIEEILYNFDAVPFFNKWLHDLRMAQREDGAIPNFVPATNSSYNVDPAWGIACVIIPWYMYLHYGDMRILDENYLMMKKWTEYLESISSDNILRIEKFGDWCPPGQIKPLNTEGTLTSTWSFYQSVYLLQRIQKILGLTKEAKKTSVLSERIKNAFNEEFLKESYYDRGSQTSNILPLYLEIVPKEMLNNVLNHLIMDIEINHDGHLSTGIIGTRYLFDTLTKHGYSELAYRIATKKTYPSWGYMINEGATTLWERWEKLASSGMNSHNHIMFGSIDAWFYKSLAGIRVDPNQPGFENVIIMSHLVGDLTYASASIETTLGKVSSSWENYNEEFFHKISLPVNSQGTVYIQKKGKKNSEIKEGNETIWKDRKFISGVPGIKKCEETEEYFKISVGSGNYSFILMS
jgi:alpha-L-rhamnosidase